MATDDIEARLAALETEMARIKTIVEKPSETEVPFWKTFAGSWANDPDYDEAVRLGREYRESLRPKKKAKQPKV